MNLNAFHYISLRSTSAATYQVTAKFSKDLKKVSEFEILFEMIQAFG